MDMWEKQQLKGGQVLHLFDKNNPDPGPEFADPNQQGEDADGDLNEEYMEIELNEDEAPFLKGQTTKAGMCMS